MLIPEIDRMEALDQSEAEKNTAIGAAVNEWKKEHPGKEPDLFSDIMPMLR
jgi:hypothetical protein